MPDCPPVGGGSDRISVDASDPPEPEKSARVRRKSQPDLPESANLKSGSAASPQRTKSADYCPVPLFQ